MSKLGKLRYIFIFASILLLAGVLLAQSTAEKTLVVNGKPAGSVVQISGHSYIDIETLAQITNGTLAVEASRIVLTIGAPVAAPSVAQPVAVEGLSRDFARTAIAELAEMREWRGAIGTILTYGVPVVGTWPQDYRDHTESDLMQVAVAATTASDQEALQLLRNEFSTLAQWAGDVVSTRQSLNATKTVNPDTVQNDPVLAKITNCGQFLSSMFVSGIYSDNSSCH